MEAFERVQAARSKGRPTGTDFINHIFDDFIEMHGDRRFGDDKAIVAGIARLNGMPVTVIALERGHDTKEKLYRNFGSAHPEGYRKALRQMKLAEKFHRPVVCFVDTAGAFCGIAAEERGQGEAIAENLSEMMTLKTPIISVFIGEGGSGGAIGLAVADEVWMLENALYSVISPEGCASILWKDSSKVISLGSSDRLTQNVIANKSIASYHPSDRRFSMLYHAEVEQYALHREAYDYYFNLQKNIEESGSLFAPIPSEMKGNIRCVTNPEVPVIGFVEVATVTRLKRFFPEIEKVYEAEVTGCASTIVQGSEYDDNSDYGYASYNPMNMESNTYALKRCMDCGRFGSKQKPSWWPTSHL